jgi:hypothetical protein
LASIWLPEELSEAAEEYGVDARTLAISILWDFREQSDFFEEAAKNLKNSVEQDEFGC